MTTIGKGQGPPPPSEAFSYMEERYQRRERRSPSLRGLGHDAMSKALNQLSKSPFTRCIEGAALPWRFQQPTFTIYNGNTDPVEHVSQFNQRMTVHSKNEALMCKVFPSSLGLAAMRWFNGLKANSIDSYRQLIQAFGSHFVTNSRALQPLSALLSLSMRDKETLRLTWADIGRCIMKWMATLMTSPSTPSKAISQPSMA